MVDDGWINEWVGGCLLQGLYMHRMEWNSQAAAPLTPAAPIFSAGADTETTDCT